MQLVNAIRQYAAIIEHCLDIIRAIVGIQAYAFDCATLYGTLCTTHLQSLWRSSLSDRLSQRLLLLFHYSPLTNQEA